MDKVIPGHAPQIPSADLMLFANTKMVSIPSNSRRESPLLTLPCSFVLVLQQTASSCSCGGHGLRVGTKSKQPGEALSREGETVRYHEHGLEVILIRVVQDGELLRGIPFMTSIRWGFMTII